MLLRVVMIHRYHLPAAPRPWLMWRVSANRLRGSRLTTAAGRSYGLRPIAAYMRAALRAARAVVTVPYLHRRLRSAQNKAALAFWSVAAATRGWPACAAGFTGKHFTMGK